MSVFDHKGETAEGNIRLAITNLSQHAQIEREDAQHLRQQSVDAATRADNLERIRDEYQTILDTVTETPRGSLKDQLAATLSANA